MEMFAVAGKNLQLYTLDHKGKIKIISKFQPKSTENNIKSISWCHDNNYLVILQENENPQILSTKDPTNVNIVHTIISIPEIVTALTFKGNTKLILALGTENGSISLYDTKNRCESKTVGEFRSKIVALEFISVNDLAVIYANSLVLFNINQPEEETVELTNPDICSTLKCLNSYNNSNNVQKKQIIAVGCSNGIVVLWNIVKKSKFYTYHLHADRITGICNKDKLTVTAGMDNKICFIDSGTHNCVFRKMFNHPITAIEISTNTDYMVVGLSDGSLYIYKISGQFFIPQVFSKTVSSPINKISFFNHNNFDDDNNNMDFMENEEYSINQSFHTNNYGGESIITPSESSSNTEISIKFTNNKMESVKSEQLHNSNKLVHEGNHVEIGSEDKLKLNLKKHINNYFHHIDEQLIDQYDSLQNLVNSELNSLYDIAARWECFKTTKLEDIVRFICGIVSESSETKILTEKSQNADNDVVP